MANAKIGSHPSYAYSFVEQVSAKRQLGRGDSGKVFMVDQSSAFTINLPKLSADIAGFQVRFVVQTAASNDVHIMAWGLSSSGGTGDSGVTNDGDTVIYKDIAFSDTGADTASSQDGVILKSGAVVGDSMDIFTDGSSWYASAFISDAAHGDDIDG